MSTPVKILRHPLDGHPYRVGQVVTLADPRAAKLVATGCAELCGGPASPQFAAMVNALRGSGKGPSPKPYTAPMGVEALVPRKAPKPRPSAKVPDVSVRLTAPEKLDGRTRNAGDLVTVGEGRAARLIAAGRAEMPSKPSPRLSARVAECRDAASLLESRGVKFATLF